MSIIFNTEGNVTNSSFKPKTIFMEIHQKNLGRHNLAISWEQTYRITNEMIHDFTFKGSILNTVRTRRHPCDEKNQVKRSICLNNFYMSKLNCSFPWIKEGMKNLPKCGRNDKIQDLMDLIIKINNEDLDTIGELDEMGCNIYNCRVERWSLIKYIQKSNPRKIKVVRVDGAPLKETKVSLFFQAAKTVSCCSFDIFLLGSLRFITIFIIFLQMEVQNESLTYDLGSFVGEVGGYLGLLLGASILSVFDEGQLLYHKLKSLICH